MVSGLASIRSSRPARPAAASSSMPTSAGPGLAVVLLDVVEDHDVLVVAEHLVEEVPQRAGLLGEGHQEVVPQALVDQRALDDLAVAADVVVAAGDDAGDRAVGREGAGQLAHGGAGQRAGGLRDDPLDLVEVEHLGAHRAGLDGDDLVDQVAHQREGHVADPARPRRRRRRCRPRAAATGPPAARAAVMLAAPSGSTPTMRTCGCRSRSQTARPATRPPPPSGATTVCTGSAAWAISSTATVPWPGDGAQVVERRHVDRAGPLGVRERGRAGDVVRAALDDQLDPALAEREDPLALLAGRVAGHVDPALDAEPRAAPRQALAVVAGARADHAAGTLGVGQPADQVVGAAHLVGAGQLPVLALEQDRRADERAQPRRCARARSGVRRAAAPRPPPRPLPRPRLAPLTGHDPSGAVRRRQAGPPDAEPDLGPRQPDG